MPSLRAAGFQKYAVKIAAMHDGVRILEARPKRLAEVDVRDLLGGERIHQAQRIDVDRHCARRLADAEIVEGMERIRVRAEYRRRSRPTLGGFFEHHDVEAFLREPEPARPPMPPPATTIRFDLAAAIPVSQCSQSQTRKTALRARDP